MKKTESVIFPLSPDPFLPNNGNAEVFFDFFGAALNKSQAKRIHNIAISGGFGTGKSSLIRSYDRKKHERKNKRKDHPHQKSEARKCALIEFFERKRQERKKTKYLYVSIGEYASSIEAKRGTKVDRNNPVEQAKDSTEIRVVVENNEAKEKTKGLAAISTVERRMLLQIFARFHRADLPQSSFRLIPEKPASHYWWVAPLAGLFLLGILLLSFHKPFEDLLIAVNDMEGGPLWGARIMNFLVEYRILFRFILASYCIAFVTVIITIISMRVLPHIRFRTFIVKGANAELSFEQETSDSYLDLYSMELVYCLERLARKISYVVVFEDLDRLNNKDCLHIMTRLREINTLVNLRLQRKKERLCFIYAINDGFLESIQHEKFFDYILPVIPEMNIRSAAKLFADKMKEIDKKYNATSEFPHFDTVVSYLSDYRLQNTILNEYHVLQKVYRSVHNCSDDELESSVKNEILAFAIYKNCWPGDYHALRKGNSQIFTKNGISCPKCFENEKYGKLLQLLTDPDNHLLTLHSLYYISFEERVLTNIYNEHWKAAIESPARHAEIIAELNAIQECETECLAIVREFFSNQEHLVKITGGQTPEYHVDVFRAVVNCMVRCHQEDNSWFFNDFKESLNLIAKLKLLAEMSSSNDELIKKEFFVISSKKIKNIENFFFAKDNDLRDMGFITKRELRELCRGIKFFSIDLIQVSDAANLTAEIESIRNEFITSDVTPYFK